MEPAIIYFVTRKTDLYKTTCMLSGWYWSTEKSWQKIKYRSNQGTTFHKKFRRMDASNSNIESWEVYFERFEKMWVRGDNCLSCTDGCLSCRNTPLRFKPEVGGITLLTLYFKTLSVGSAGTRATTFCTKVWWLTTNWANQVAVRRWTWKTNKWNSIVRHLCLVLPLGCPIMHCD